MSIRFVWARVRRAGPLAAALCVGLLGAGEPGRAFAQAGAGMAGVAPAEVPLADTVAQRARACLSCHGEQGRQLAEGYAPRLGGKPAPYLLHQMIAFRDGRRPHTGMARLMAPLDDAMLAELAAHFAAQGASPRPAMAGMAPQAAEAASRAAQLVRQGSAAQRLPACAACHGQALAGDGQRVPGLLGLPRDYVVSQMGAWRQGLRQAGPGDCMAEVARRLKPEDLPLVADWLARQPPAAPGPTANANVNAAGAATAAAAGLACALAPAPAAVPLRRPSDPPPGSAVARGAYLARLGNCAGCHQGPGRDDLSGGAPLLTPFGVVHAGNLTPDPATGLGHWTSEDFWRALHQGRGRDGRRLVPAFPYTSYTHMSRRDSDDLWAYLRAQPPVVRARPAHQLRFPYGTQWALALWQALFFEPASASPPPVATGGGDTLLARGRYLVEGPGHCLECHAPRGSLGQRSARPDGAVMPMGEAWAPPLNLGPEQTEADVVALLRTGRNAHTTAMGPMGRVVQQSTQHWRLEDLQAAARHLASLPRLPRPSAAAPAPAGELARGAGLYREHCASCHGGQGQGGWVGGRLVIAPLAGNPSVAQPALHNLVRVLRQGAFGPRTDSHPRPFGMPPVTLSTSEQAALLSYVRQAWGPPAGAVSELDLAVLR